MSTTVHSGTDRPVAAGESRSDISPAWISAAAVVKWAPVPIFAALAWHRRWTSDDGFINLRVVQQITHGNGPVFNAGERVEAFTSPLWIAVLTMARLVLPHAIRLEYIALWLALAASVFGLAAAIAASSRLMASAVAPGTESVGATFWTRRTLFPVGALLVAGLPSFWDFATSGLESGLIFAWLGGTFWWLVVAVAPDATGSTALTTSRRTRLGLAAIIGLGPLIRPDLGLMTVPLLVALVLCDRPRAFGRIMGIVATALALPLAYEIFRMGYYAALVPNTAIAKDAGGAQWHQGLEYVGDLATRFYVWIPLVAVAASLWWLLTRQLRVAHRRGERIVVSAVLAAGALHLLYVVRVGGDFMSGRMLLPALFAFAMPVAVVPLRPRAVAAWVAVAGVWAGLCLATLSAGPGHGIAVVDDEHAVYVTQSGSPHPVTLSDYGRAPWLGVPARMRADLRSGRRELFTDTFTWWYGYIDDTPRVLPLATGLPELDAIVAARIGALSYSLGVNVYVVDRFSLADPLGSHFSGEPVVKPGHNAVLTLPWIEATRAGPNSRDPDPKVAAQVDQARHVLICSAGVRQLRRDVERPLTVGGFFSNIAESWSNTTLRVPYDTTKAVAELCR